jgi:ATP-dependent protease ClpP protease subunit
VGFAGSFALILVLALGSNWLGRVSPSEQPPLDWVSESAQQGIETWEFDPEDPLVQKRIILVNTWINELATEKVVTLLTYLNEIDSQEPITLYLTSIGGYTKDAYAIAHAMQASEAPVDTVALGDCFSACTKVFMSGTGERKMIENSRIAIHTHAYPFDGDPYSPNTILYQREREFFQTNSDIPLDWISREEKFYYLSPEEALTFQLADTIVPAPSVIEE